MTDDARAQLRHSFFLALCGTAVVGGALLALGGVLRTEAAPAGVFDLELNFGPERLAAMYSSYGAATREALGFQLGLDYLFMPCYATAIATGLLLQRRAWTLATPLVAAQFVAAGLDAVENAFLYDALMSGVGAVNAWGTTACAGVKFLLIALGLIALLLGLLPLQRAGVQTSSGAATKP